MRHCNFCVEGSGRKGVCLFVQVKLNRGLDFPSLDDILVDMKLAPEVLELPCPAYFREDRAKVTSGVLDWPACMQAALHSA